MTNSRCSHHRSGSTAKRAARSRRRCRATGSIYAAWPASRRAAGRPRWCARASKSSKAISMTKTAATPRHGWRMGRLQRRCRTRRAKTGIEQEERRAASSTTGAKAASNTTSTHPWVGGQKSRRASPTSTTSGASKSRRGLRFPSHVILRPVFSSWRTCPKSAGSTLAQALTPSTATR